MWKLFSRKTAQNHGIDNSRNGKTGNNPTVSVVHNSGHIEPALNHSGSNQTTKIKRYTMEEWDDLKEANPLSYFPIVLSPRQLNEDGRLPVVGESFYQEALHLVADGKAFEVDISSHLPVQTALIPEPENPYDDNAVRVDIVRGNKTLKVGYLARDLAIKYQPKLLGLRRAGEFGVCAGRITGGGWKYYGIYLHLAPASELLSAPSADSSHLRQSISTSRNSPFAFVDGSTIRLVADWSCTVTGEEAHQDTLSRYESRDGNPKIISATLHYCDVQKGKYEGGHAIEVQIDGQRVGQLTHAMTQRYTGIIDDVHARGATAQCEAMVHRTAKGLEVELSMPPDPEWTPRPRTSLYDIEWNG